MISVSKRWIVLIAVAAVILLIPVIAMQFSSKVNWGLFDFVLAAFLLFSVACGVEWIIRVRRLKWELLVAFLLLGVMVWLELAVGVFGTAFAGN